MEKSKLSTGTLIVLVIGVVIGFLIGWGVYGRSGDQSKNLELGDEVTTLDSVLGTLGKEGTRDGATGTSATLATTGILSVNDQWAGQTVTVLNVKADGMVWVAVRDYAAGKLGNILGAQKVSGGDKLAVAIPLLRATVAGQSYAVVIYQDNGDKLFNHQTDQLLEAEGRPVQAVFRAK